MAEERVLTCAVCQLRAQLKTTAFTCKFYTWTVKTLDSFVVPSTICISASFGSDRLDCCASCGLWDILKQSMRRMSGRDVEKLLSCVPAVKSPTVELPDLSTSTNLCSASFFLTRNQFWSVLWLSMRKNVQHKPAMFSQSG